MLSPSERARTLDDRFADNLLVARTIRRMPRRALAERSGIPEHSIEKIETGAGSRMRRTVSIGEAVVLAEALGINPADLLRGGEPR